MKNEWNHPFPNFWCGWPYWPCPQIVCPHRCLSLQFWIVLGLCLDRFIGLGHNPTRHQNWCPHQSFFRDLTIYKLNSGNSDGILKLLSIDLKLAYSRTGLLLNKWEYFGRGQQSSNQIGLDRFGPKCQIGSSPTWLDDCWTVKMTLEGPESSKNTAFGLKNRPKWIVQASVRTHYLVSTQSNLTGFDNVKVE